MSSATSTDTLQPWQLFTLAGLIGATVVVFMSRGQSPVGVVLLSLLVFAAAAVGSAALRAFLPLTSKAPDHELQILGGRTRAALEREKTLVLRSIKELEFDRAMRKVSEKDFAEMSGRLRARAARLMRQLDAGSMYREQIEKELERRLGAAAGGAASPAIAAPRTPPQSPDVSSAAPAAAAEEASHTADVLLLCASCKTQNDPDARFCKGCGARFKGAR